MAMFETLESRQFLSVSVGEYSQLTAQMSAFTTTATIPNMKGTFKGTFMDRGWHEQTKLGLRITSQSGGTISGTLFDNQGGTLRFTGTVRANHTFTIKTYGNTHCSYKITGQLNAKRTFFTGDITGKIAGKASYGPVWMSKATA